MRACPLLRLPIVALAILTPVFARADEPNEPERTWILGLGAAVDLELQGANVHAGGNVMVEYEAIESWLELELGVSVLSAPNGVQVPIDLLFKKPFRLSPNFELMIGLGPELLYISGPAGGTFGGIEFAADFMFWPAKHFGFWIEPSYEIVFQSPVSHGLGCTAGLLFAW